ncbi:CoA-binding protein [Variovorax defluvii]|uniref:CoA-binding protein n=1 Tax=Variovorax defluvii TaxID=913761 RepID=A0ABP8I1A0_9BURK
MAILEEFGHLFRPSCIAVVGASATSVSGGNRFIRHLRNFGYAGRVVPIHPTAPEVEGLSACKSLADVPEAVDYAYVAVAARNAPDVLRSGRGKVRFAQVMSSGFGETGGGASLERELAAAAREAGVRLIGPNCLGVYSPAGRVTFTEKTQPEAGPVGIVCQSGGLGIDIIRRGQSRGLRYSGLVTIGNAADVAASELIEYFLEDDNTRVIGLYLESTREGRRLFDVLRRAKARKPVVLLKGGRTSQGQRAAASHTGALAGSQRAWDALGRQTGTPMVDTLDEFLDALATLQCLAPRATASTRAVLFGNGGGTSVLGSDAFDRAGFSIAAFDAATLQQLEAFELPAGSSVANPIDVPAGALQQDEGRVAERIIATVAASSHADALVIHVNMTVILGFRHVDMLGNIIRAVLRVRESDRSGLHVALVLRSDGDAETEQRKRDYCAQAMASGVPVFDELAQAARGLAALRTIEAHRARLAAPAH